MALAVVLATAMLVAAGILAYQPAPRLPYRTYTDMLAQGRVESVELSDAATMRVIDIEGQPYQTENPRREGYKEYLLDLGVAVGEAGTQPLPAIVGIALLVAVLIVGVARQGKGKAGIAKYASMESAKSAVPDITFEDVAANDEARANLRGLVDFIRNPDHYAAYGARIPHGVMLYGPPGTGKTLMARALAGEAGVPFYAVTGSDFVQVYVGVGASRVRELFKKARKAERAVIFIDEIDALGKRRESANDEREQTLNALLSEMSGFSAQEGVVVMAATNRLETLDEALLRPGRFDRQIEVGLPRKEERLRILRLHVRNKPLAQNVDLAEVAANTVFFSGAKLESMLNEAAILAARRQADAITHEDIDRAMQTILVGEEKADRSGVNVIEKRVTAVHEAAHALATLLTLPESNLSRVSIIPSTKGAAGYSMAILPDRMFHTREELEAHVQVALAGRAGEEIIFGPDKVTTGAANDLKRATELITRMCFEWGMDEDIGPISRDAQTLDEGGQSTLQGNAAALYERTLALLRKHQKALLDIAAALEEREVLTGDAVRAILQAA
ncbi:MAG: AAA family ATPase [Clostridia bacterium]|nr:AAA family ATPase [Clostridia bacterium]